jgi:hypothetical protein
MPSRCSSRLSLVRETDFSWWGKVMLTKWLRALVTLLPFILELFMLQTKLLRVGGTLPLWPTQGRQVRITCWDERFDCSFTLFLIVSRGLSQADEECFHFSQPL